MIKSLRMILAGFLVLILLGPAGLLKAEEGGDATSVNKALELKEKLGLTDDQVAKLKVIAESEKAEYKPLILSGLADVKILGDKLKTGASDAELNPVVDRIEATRKSVEAAKTKYIAQVRTVLNPTQQSKLVVAVAVVKLAVLKKIIEMKKGK